MIETIREEEESKLADMKSAFEGKREGVKNQNVEDLESMKHDLIKKIELLDQQFEKNFQQFVSDTETKAESYDELLRANQDSSKNINDYQKQINRLKEQIQFLELKTKQNKKECDDRNKSLMREKNKIIDHYRDLKVSM